MVVSVRYMAIVSYRSVVADDGFAPRRANFARLWRSSPRADSTSSLAAETFLGGDSVPDSHWVRASRRRSFPLLVRGSVPGASNATWAGWIRVCSWTRDATSSGRVEGGAGGVARGGLDERGQRLVILAGGDEAPRDRASGTHPGQPIQRCLELLGCVVG